MNPEFFLKLRGLAVGAVVSLVGQLAAAEPQYAIAMYGQPALPPDFVALPYANVDAPFGGRVVTAEVGTFDSLNPFVQKGSVPWQLSYLVSETLMGRSLDEPFSLYGLLAESVDTGPNREWVEFTLRPEARFSDGSPVTVEDVIWSFETLGTQGHGRYAGFWGKVASIEATGQRSVKITFSEADRELVMLAGLRPILQKAMWEGLDFAESGIDTIPITSGPYVVDSYEAGRFVVLKRNPDYWGQDIPFRRGTNVIDEIRMDFYADETTAFEAFKVGDSTLTRETNVARWDSQYDFPLVQSGDIVLDVIPHSRPSGMTGFVMNTRQPLFANWQVREAMLLAFNFEFINDAMTGGAQPRITSFFSNSPLAMTSGPAEGRVLEMLQPYAADLLPGAIDGYALPVSDGTERNRSGIEQATALLEAAGWTVQEGVLKNAAGEPFTFEILLQSGSTENQSIIDMYVESLSRLGIAATVTNVDAAQYKERTDAYDFDMTYYRRALTLSPGNEQNLYWGSAQAEDVGGRNLMGVKSPAIDGLINTLLTSADQSDFVAAVQALDRVLTTGRYVIPIYQWNVSRIAHSSNLHYPERLPLFGDWPGWQPDVWWYEE